MSSEVRVLVVGPMPPTKGGVTTFMMNLMGSPVLRDFRFHRFNTGRPPKKNVTNNWGYGAMFRGGVVRIFLGVAITLFHMAKYPFVVLSVKPQIIQIQASDYLAFWESIYYVFVGRVFNRRVVLRIGGAFDQFVDGSSMPMRWLLSKALGLPDRVVVQSKFARTYVESLGRHEGVIVLSNWTPPERIAEQPKACKQTPIALFIVGSDGHRKGLEEVVEVAKEFSTSDLEVRFHFIGVPSGIKDELETLRLNNISKLEGFVSHERILEAMRDADIFLLPSHGEGFPNSLVEAMAAGMASVVTPVGAVPEIVAGGGAIVVPPKSARDLATALLKLASDPVLRREVGIRAMSVVRDCYTEGAVLPVLRDEYHTLASPGGWQCCG